MQVLLLLRMSLHCYRCLHSQMYRYVTVSNNYTLFSVVKSTITMSSPFSLILCRSIHRINNYLLFWYILTLLRTISNTFKQYNIVCCCWQLDSFMFVPTNLHQNNSTFQSIIPSIVWIIVHFIRG